MLVTSKAHRQIGVRYHRLWGIDVFRNRINFLRARLSRKAWGRDGIHLVLCRMAWRGGEGRSPRQSAIGSVHMWHENAQLPFLHLNPNNCDCHCLWFGNSAEQTVGCIGVPTFIFMITLDLHHELNFWLVLWRFLVIFPMLHNAPLWWKPKSFLVQVFQVPKPHPSPAFFLFWVSWIHIFFFLLHNHCLLPGIITFGALWVRLPWPMPLLLAATLYNSFTKSFGNVHTLWPINSVSQNTS